MWEGPRRRGPNQQSERQLRQWKNLCASQLWSQQYLQLFHSNKNWCAFRIPSSIQLSGVDEQGLPIPLELPTTPPSAGIPLPRPVEESAAEPEPEPESDTTGVRYIRKTTLLERRPKSLCVPGVLLPSVETFAKPDPLAILPVVTPPVVAPPTTTLEEPRSRKKKKKKNTEVSRHSE